MVGLGGLGPPTSRLSGVRSNHLSYKPVAVKIDARTVINHLSLKGGDPAAGSPTATLLRLHPSH